MGIGDDDGTRATSSLGQRGDPARVWLIP